MAATTSGNLFSRNSRFQDSQMLKSEIANGNIFSSEFGFQDSQSWNQKLHIQMAMFFLGILDSSFLKFWKSWIVDLILKWETWGFFRILQIATFLDKSPQSSLQIATSTWPVLPPQKKAPLFEDRTCKWSCRIKQIGNECCHLELSWEPLFFNICIEKYS